MYSLCENLHNSMNKTLKFKREFFTAFININTPLDRLKK